MKSQENFVFLICVAVTVTFYNFQKADALNLDTNYTEKETELLTKLRLATTELLYADYQKLDSYLIHFLRRKKLDLIDAKTLLKDALKWRKEKKIDGILEEKMMTKLEKKFPVTIDGVDKDGRPILSYILHKWDIRRFILAGNAADYRRYQIYIFEKVTQLVYALAISGNDVSQFNILIDFSGFNMRQHACVPCLQGLSDIVPLIESKYPNAANQIIFVNVPRSFGPILKFIKTLLPESLQNLIHVFGYDKVEWRKYLNKIIDDEQLAAAFGGTRA